MNGPAPRLHKSRFHEKASKRDLGNNGNGRSRRPSGWRVSRRRREEVARQFETQKGEVMSYLVPSELVVKVIDAGEMKVNLSTRDTLIRAYMGGALLTLAAAFAVTVSQQTGYPIIGAALFPVGFCILYLMGFDLVTGVFVLAPLALLDRRPGVTPAAVLRNWGLVFLGNFMGAFTVAVMMAIVFTFGFSTEPNAVGKAIAGIGEARTLGYKAHGAAGMLTLFVRGVLCNWMVSTGVVGAMISTTVGGKVLAMWMPIMIFFAMTFEHSVVNMFLFPSALLMGGKFSVADYLLWNELPTTLGNMVGGLPFTGLTLYMTHRRTAPSRRPMPSTGIASPSLREPAMLVGAPLAADMMARGSVAGSVSRPMP